MLFPWVVVADLFFNLPVLWCDVMHLCLFHWLKKTNADTQ